MPNVVVTGGPGVGKTTLLSALREAGYATVPESARHIIAERLALGLAPRPSPLEFAREIVRRDIAAYEASKSLCGWVFFDRGLIDGVGLLSEATNLGEAEVKAILTAHPFHHQAFVLPPWQRIYVTDNERDQSFSDCLRIHQSLLRWYKFCGVQLCEVPPGPVSERVAFVQEWLAASEA
jgi:predicted ATPase